jgi:hypothetical protein
LTKLWSEHKKDMQELDKGGKPDDKLKALVEKTAKAAAKGFKDN